MKHRTINDISDFSHPIVKSVYAVSRRPTKWQSVAKLTPTNCAYQLQRTVYLVASSFFSRKHEKINTPGKPNHRRDIHIVTRKSLLSISIQGQPSGFDIMYLALADRNMQVRFGLKVFW